MDVIQQDSVFANGKTETGENLSPDKKNKNWRTKLVYWKILALGSQNIRKNTCIILLYLIVLVCVVVRVIPEYLWSYALMILS